MPKPPGARVRTRSWRRRPCGICKATPPSHCTERRRATHTRSSVLRELRQASDRRGHCAATAESTFAATQGRAPSRSPAWLVHDRSFASRIVARWIELFCRTLRRSKRSRNFDIATHVGREGQTIDDMPLPKIRLRRNGIAAVTWQARSKNIAVQHGNTLPTTRQQHCK